MTNCLRCGHVREAHRKSNRPPRCLATIYEYYPGLEETYPGGTVVEYSYPCQCLNYDDKVPTKE